MLVLSRKSGEALVIGDNVKVYVSRILGNRVTLAIEAPNEVHVVRGELRAAMDAEASARATVPADDRAHLRSVAAGR